VNVYVVVPAADVFIVAGLHAPVIASMDAAGKGGATAF
jgi:hypothetical protein